MLSYQLIYATSIDGDSIEWTAQNASQTLPILYINTEDSVPVVDKETKIPAGLWVEIPDACESKDFTLGSLEKPVEITIKGRGNASWLLDKKPYKIKFEKKTEFLGMPKQKHFALLNSSGGSGIAQMMGMELARIAGMDWAPRLVPVELVLNGEYLGLYNVAESIKIDKNRVNIYEQEDLNEDEETIPYGWLVEIDNYSDSCQIVIKEPGWTTMRVTYHTPEELSEMQENWLYDEFYKLNETIYSKEDSIKESWANIIDAHSLAKLFLVREVLGDKDGFNGSFYLYKDKGENSIWKAGPMWDPMLDCAQPPTDWVMNNLPSYSKWKIIPQVFYTKAFSDAFIDEWQTFYPKLEDIAAYMEDYASKVCEASSADKNRWPDAALITIDAVKSRVQWIRNSSKWIDENKYYYDDYLSGIDNVVVEESGDSEIYTLDGRKVLQITAKGIYIIKIKMDNGTIETKKIFYQP